MIARYFQSRGISLATVKAAKPNNFKELVDRFFNVCVPLNVTRAAYHQMSKEERDDAKKVPYLTPAVFQTTPSRRLYECATVCNLIFLDIDEDKDPITKQPNGKFPAAPYVNNLDTLATQLEPFNWAVYHTASSLPNAPRIRIVIDAEGIPIASYAAAVATIAKRIGLPLVTKESRVAVQAMYVPILFAGHSEDEHPLLDFETGGRPFNLDDIDKETSPAGVPPTHSVRQTGGDDMNALEFMRAPVDEITLDIAKEALSAIDPDINYHDWLEVATALKHQFFPVLDDEAYTLFDDWSRKGSKYVSEDETRQKWDSFLHTPNGRLPITIRSLLKRAVDGGWQAEKVKDECFKNILTWIQVTCRSSTQLLADGLKKIAVTPLISRAEEDALVHEVRKQLKKRFSVDVSLTNLRKELQIIKADLSNKEVKKQPLPMWSKGLVYIASDNQFLRQHTGEVLSMEALDALYGKRLLPTEEMLRAQNLPVTPAALSKPFVLPRHYLLNHLKCPTAYARTYDPSSPDDLFPIEGGKVLCNTYVRTAPDPDETNAMAIGNIFRRHLENLILEPEYIRTIIDYIAFMVQHPGRKIRWAMLIQGAEGCGKSYLAEILRLVLGKEHVMAIDLDSIKRGWNEWNSGRQVIVIEEIRVVGQNRHEVMGALKPLITNPTVTVNQRNHDTRETVNRTNYIAFTNYPDALVLLPDSRRWFILKSRIQTKAQVKMLPVGYFQRLFKSSYENAAGLRWFFENWRISEDFEADGNAPETKYLHELIADSASELTAAVRKVLREGEHPLVKQDLLSSKVLLDLLRTRESLTKINAQHLAAVLREEKYVKREEGSKDGRHMVNGERHYLWTHIGLFDDNLCPQHEAEKRVQNFNTEFVDGDVLL